MLKSFFVLLRYFIFWMIFFFLDRIVFLLYFNEKAENADSFEIFLTFLNGLRLDASTAVYLSGIPLLCYVVIWIFKLKVPMWVPRLYVHILITLLSFISIVNFNVYREWGGKISYRILDFLFTSPKEAIASSSSSPITSSFVIFFILVISAFWVSGRVIEYQIPKERVPVWQKIIASLLFIGVAGLIARGGWQLSPINQSMAYFSDKTFLNHAAVNTEWNLIHDVINNKYLDENPYQYFSDAEAEEKVAEIYSEREGNTIKVLKNNRPNVVFIILESFTGNVVESLGGEKGVAPNLENLIQGGLFFDNIYASGDRTDRGMVALLSGFPSQAIRSIMKQNGKQEKLPGIGSVLDSCGYRTSFYYGGESEFFNLKSYVLSHGYRHIVDKKAFSNNDMNSKWGAYDHAVYQKYISDMMQPEEPFFSTILTLTNHEPFELPVEPKFGNGTVEDQFRSTAFYTDAALYEYLQKAKERPWYKNTLFVVVADHGHRLPASQYENYHPNRYKIPLLFFGDVLEPQFRGKVVSKIGSQTDIATTLLKQLNLPAEKFKWGKDLLDPTSTDFAFFDWDNGFGVVTPQQSISFDNVGKQVIYKQNEHFERDDQLLDFGKAYMQCVFQQYINY